MDHNNDKTISNENNSQINQISTKVSNPHSNDQNHKRKNQQFNKFNLFSPPIINKYPYSNRIALNYLNYNNFNINNNIINISNNIQQGQIEKLNISKNTLLEKGNENKGEYTSSKKSSIFTNDNNSNDSTLIVYDPSKDEPEEPLFEEIKNKLDKNDYKQEELINDMILLIEKIAFIKQFNEYSFLKIDSFVISNNNNPKIIHLKLNLIYFINIINAISYYSKSNLTQFVEILNKLGIYFSWVKCEDYPDTAVAVLLTPKSSNLYNHISTHGGFGICNGKYKEDLEKFFSEGDKSGFDYGYCYEDFSVSHLIDLIGKGNYQIFPNVMYFIKADVAEKLIKSEIFGCTGDYKIFECPFLEKQYREYSFCETDLIINIFKNIEIESNFNFRDIIKGDLNAEENKIILEEKKYYLFEIKASIDLITKDIEKIEKVQKKFIEALKNIKVDGENPYEGKTFQRILMCDNNYQKAKEGANNKKLNNTLIYSGFQVGITHINRLNNNIRDLYKKIGDLEGENTEWKGQINSLNEQINSQNKQLKEQAKKIKEIDLLKGEITALRNENNSLKESINKLIANYSMSNNQNQSHTDSNQNTTNKNDENVLKNDKKAENGIIDKINKTKFIENKLKLLDNVLKENSILISVRVTSENRLSLIKETFEIFFEQFKLIGSILQEISENCENLLFLRIESLLNNNKNDSDLSQIAKLLLEKIQKNDACSIYYEGVKNLLFGDDEKTNLEMLKVLNILDEKKKYYIKQLIEFIEIFENNQNIENIEMKMQGAILFIMLKLYDDKKLISIFDEVNKNNDNVRNIIKILISSLNSRYKHIHN